MILKTFVYSNFFGFDDLLFCWFAILASHAIVDCYCHHWIFCFVFYLYLFHRCHHLCCSFTKSNTIIAIHWCFCCWCDYWWWCILFVACVHPPPAIAAAMTTTTTTTNLSSMSSFFSSSRGCCYCCCSLVTNTLPVVVSFVCPSITAVLQYHPVALYLLLPMDRVLLLLLIVPSTSVLPLLLFELFLCSSLVAADADADAADDDHDDDDLYQWIWFYNNAQCLSFCCIPRINFCRIN